MCNFVQMKHTSIEKDLKILLKLDMEMQSYFQESSIGMEFTFIQMIVLQSVESERFTTNYIIVREVQSLTKVIQISRRFCKLF